MQPPKWLLVLGLGACVLSHTYPYNDPDLATSQHDVVLPENVDETPDKHDALLLSGALGDLASCDEFNCFCRDGDCYEKKGRSCDRDRSCEIKAHLCRAYRNYPPGYSPPAHCTRESPAISHSSSGHLLENGNTFDARHEAAAMTIKHAKGPVSNLLEEQCNVEASEALEVILQNYLDDLVDNNSHKASAKIPCSRVVLYDITGDGEDVGGRLSKLWHWSDDSNPSHHHGAQAPFRGNNVNAITVLTRKDPLLMNTTLALNPKQPAEKLADFNVETCVVNMLAAIVPSDDQTSKTPTLKVTLSSGGTEDHTETWSCAKSTSLQKTSFIMERIQSAAPETDPFVQPIPHHATMGQTFSVDVPTLNSMRFSVHGPLTVIATSPPAYSGTITMHLKDTTWLTVSVQASTDYHLTPPAVVITKSALGTRGSYTVPLPLATPIIASKLTHTPSTIFKTAAYDESQALHALKKKECEDRMLLRPASKGQKCMMTVDFFGQAIKATLTATATNPPGWSAKVKDKDKHTGTVEYRILTDHEAPMTLITANADDEQTTITIGKRALTLPVGGAYATTTSRWETTPQYNRLYAGLPSPASSGQVFTNKVNLNGREVVVSGSITATSPTGFVMTIGNDTAAATLSAELDEAHDPVMVKASIFSDGTVATMTEPWLPGGFTDLVNPDTLDMTKSRHTGALLQGRQVFTPATPSTATLSKTTTTIAASGPSQVITTTRTTTVTVLTGGAPPSIMTEPPVTLTNTVMSLGDKIIPITGSSRQIVNNTIMTVVYPPRANLNVAACDRNRLVALEDALGSNVTSPEFTNLTLYRALHPEYNWDAVKHYAEQLKPETEGNYATQLAVLCMRNGDQKFTSASCPCNTEITTTINGNILVLPAQTTAAPFTPSGVRSTFTVIQVGSTVLPYNVSSTYPPGARTEVVFATPTSSQVAESFPTFTLPSPVASTKLSLVTLYLINGHTVSLGQSPGAVVSTTISNTPLVFTMPLAIPFTPSGTRTKIMVVQAGTTILPYDASTTYPPDIPIEIVEVSGTRTLYSAIKGTNLLFVPTPTAAPNCKNSDRGCRISKCLWNHQKPVNISTVMPALMDDPYDGHMMYDYFTQRTSLTGRPHWGTTAESGLYYPIHLETHSVSGIYAVRETPTPIKRKRSLVDSEPIVHPAPACFDADSCYATCQKQVRRHSKILMISGSVAGIVIGIVLLTAGIGMLVCCCKSRRRTNPNPASQATTPMQSVDPVTGQSLVPVVSSDSSGRTTAVDPSTGASGTKPALRGAGTLGRQAEEGRGRVHFGEDQPGGAGEGATSAPSGAGNGTGSGPDAGAMTGSAADATTVTRTSAADATRATTEAVPAGDAAAAAQTVTQPAAATSQVFEKTIPDATTKMAQGPEDVAEHVEAVPAHDGADSRRTGSEVADMGSIRGRRRMRPNGHAFD
ncbi:hypothetical protein DOTSEDRAFT_76939 [Dothistroma septosporum NZE10]|uniref:Extracellular membrane protein CFEM domain-containing protein n=1 Tax=Dothistroma septosporum (strain NZE10 / CBS 128990) TaxID=675120 RepID=N1Q214_DOTSN|nr:hypothetical protein DOTSEDRAFT_76939 [Dothistroma septosporum NZE10]